VPCNTAERGLVGATGAWQWAARGARVSHSPPFGPGIAAWPTAPSARGLLLLLQAREYAAAGLARAAAWRAGGPASCLAAAPGCQCGCGRPPAPERHPSQRSEERGATNLGKKKHNKFALSTALRKVLCAERRAYGTYSQSPAGRWREWVLAAAAAHSDAAAAGRG
jgi:hypothetical protein